MPEFSTLDAGAIRTVGATGGASSESTFVTSGGSANTKGSWIQLTAATEFDAHWVLVTITGADSQTFLVDIGMGAGGAETVIIPDLFAVSRELNGSYAPYLFPVFVPRGSRIAARSQAASGGMWCQIAVTLISGTALSGGPGPSQVSAYGAVASSLGTNVDPGATADTDSGWVEIAAATDRAHHWLVVSCRYGDAALSSSSNWRLSLGIGPAGSEQVLVADLHASAGTATSMSFNPVICLPCFVPAGSRLSAKVRARRNTDGDRDVWLKLYGAG